MVHPTVSLSHEFINNLACLRLIGSIEHGQGHVLVLLVLVNVPWVRLDEVKAVVND